MKDKGNDTLALESLYLGGRPLIQPFLERLRVRPLLAQALGKPDPRLKLPHVDSALLLLSNFILARHPLYGVPEWTRRFVPSQLELDADQATAGERRPAGTGAGQALQGKLESKKDLMHRSTMYPLSLKGIPRGLRRQGLSSQLVKFTRECFSGDFIVALRRYHA